MNNLKQYKKHFGKEFNGSDEKTYMFYNSKAVTQMFTLINKLQQENKQLKEELEKDKIEQFDDYVIYLLEKYLSMLGDNNE